MIVVYVSCNLNVKFLLKLFTFCIINEIERGIHMSCHPQLDSPILGSLHGINIIIIRIIRYINHYTWSFLRDILRLPSSCRAALGLYICQSYTMTSTGLEPATMGVGAGASRAIHYATGEDRGTELPQQKIIT